VCARTHEGIDDGRTTEVSDRAKTLTPGEASRALYIDFEGEKGKAPVLLGCVNRPGKGEPPWVWQAVTWELFKPLVRSDDIVLLPLPDTVERIVARAEAKDRLIVAWSEHELNIVKEHCPEKLERFESRFVNARRVAVRWRNKCHAGQRPDVNTLAAYLDLMGYRITPGGEAGRAGETIRIVRTSFEKGRGLAGLTENQLRRWKDLRQHNRDDCLGMRKVCLRAAREIAEHAA